ncbi:hypothetical protein [Mucilaginibacter sp. HD30]
MRNFYKIFIAVSLLTATNVNYGYAGGTPVRKGVYVLSTSFSYFSSTQKWDVNGKTVDYDNNGYFNSGGVSVYGEYGASRQVTLIASLPYSYNTYQSAGKSITQGLGDAEIGARYYLGNVDFKFYMALQGSMIIPLYNVNTSQLGFGAFGADFKLIGSGTATTGDESSLFYSLEAGGRQYFNETGPFQFRSAATLGYSFDKENLISLSGAGVISTSSNKSFANNILLNKDFKYFNATASVGHIFAPALAVYVNYTKFFVGTNTGIGSNASLSFITKF